MASTTLESDILHLETLDRLRSRANELREEGFRALYQSFTVRHSADPLRPKSKSTRSILETWSALSEEPSDHIQPALQYQVATSAFVSHASIDNKSLQQYRDAQLDRLRALKLDDLFETPLLAENTPSEEGDARIRTPLGSTPGRSRVELFQAARVFHALARSPKTIFSKSSLLAYYRIVRELYSVAEPNWFIGSARASHGGVPTAFMTGECTRAINAFARAIEQTERLVRFVIERYHDMVAVSANTQTPSGWQCMELARQWLSTYNVVADLKRRAFLDIDIQTLASNAKSMLQSTSESPEQRVVQSQSFLRQLMESVSNCLGDTALVAAAAANEALEEIDSRFKLEEQSATASSRGGVDPKMSLSHSTARHAIDTVKQLAEAAGRAALNFGSYTRQFTVNKSSPDFVKVDEYLEILHSASERVRRVFLPAKTYVESVLDRELARSSTGRINVGELTFAAATYVQIQSPERDNRIALAINLVLKAISEDGTFDSPGHLDTDTHGYSLILLGSEVLRALAHLLERAEEDVSIESLEAMLRYFETTAIRYPEGGRLTGWCHDMPRYPRKATGWTTALAILALDRIARMLDATINRRIARHFTTRSWIELRRTKPTLSQLMYPDYGLAMYAPRDIFPSNTSGQSVAFILERMRAHLLGLPYSVESLTPCYSLILHGPPGTGKTTLVEALSASSQRNLVEITPSDFLVEGEAFVERRARIVFMALSFLTDTVIVFDEFDPMLRSREDESLDGERSVFSFLTPGLLPKLKNLNVQARRRKTAFCLITNRIGTLDDAAIRSGRFDYKMGVYPPDPLARAGYMARMLDQVSRQDATFEHWSDNENFQQRAIEVLLKTRDAAMTMLSCEGNMRAPRSNMQDDPTTILEWV